MQTDCSLSQLAFQAFNGRTVKGSFDGGHITSDAGGLFCVRSKEGQAFIHRFSQLLPKICVTPAFVEHSVYQLVSQRTYGLCFGNEDLNDHDQLRADPLLALLCGKKDLEERLEGMRVIAGRPWRARARLNRLETARRCQSTAVQEDHRRDGGTGRVLRGSPFSPNDQEASRAVDSGF